MNELSVVIISCNEERIIAKTLEAVAPLASEIILVDSGSTDRTLEIAKQYNAQRHRQQWLGYAAQKNYALSLATKNWVLSLDADEIVSETLAKEIQALLSSTAEFSSVTTLSSITDPPSHRSNLDALSASNSQNTTNSSETKNEQTIYRSTQLCDGYRIPRLLYIGDTPLWHGGFYPDAQLRLFKNGKGKFIERKVHESVQLQGTIGDLHSPLLHYSYNDFSDYAKTLDHYARLSAEEFYDQTNKNQADQNRAGQSQAGQNQANQSRADQNTLAETTTAKLANGSIEKIWRSSKLNEMLHPIWTFSYRYFLRAGFLDGAAGLKANLIYQDYVRKKITYLRQLQPK